MLTIFFLVFLSLPLSVLVFPVFLPPPSLFCGGATSLWACILFRSYLLKLDAEAYGL